MQFFVALGDCPEREDFFSPRVMEVLPQYGTFRFNPAPGLGMEKAALIEQIGDADVLITGWGSPRVDADVLRAAPNLKIHAHTGGSVANLVCKEEYDRGILVLSGNDLFAQSVAEGCLCYTLDALRRVDAYRASVRAGGWMPEPHRTKGLIGKKVGLVSYGAIASYYAGMLQGFGVDLRIASRTISEEELRRVGAKRASIEEIFAECDVISLHTALNDHTEGMITRELLHSIRDGALFVNTARAALVDEQALYEELQTGRFAAALDVFHTEPLPENNPLRSLPNVLVMPHVAGPTTDLRQEVTLRLLADIRAHQEGRPCRSEIPYEYAIRMTR